MKTKYYDKEIHARNESIKGILVIIISFILGFAAGYVAVNQELENKVEDQETTIILRNGYSYKSPAVKCKCTVEIGEGKKEWGADPDINYYIIKIIEIMEVQNVN